jgi:hypothetical protein
MRILLDINTLPIALWGFLVIVLIAIGASILQTEKNWAKHLFFWSIGVISILITALFLAQTIVKNINSETGGPVHWHADFRIFNCYEELDLIDPTGLLNRIGTSEIHEHGDKRIHIEGTLQQKKEASLGNFFRVIGGELTPERMIVPTNFGLEQMTNGNTCLTDPTAKGAVQVFLWKTENKIAKQVKLENFSEYIISPFSPVPAGDCLIFEFAPNKKYTTHVCDQYKVAEKNGDLTIENPL